MVGHVVRRCAAAGLAVLTAAGCAHAVRQDAAPRPAGVLRGATLDSARARQLCAAPESVLAGRAPCVLRNQAPPLRVF